MPKKKKSVVLEEIEDIEKWIYERRKFLIKFGLLLIFIIVLLIISNIFMQVQV